MRDTSSTLPNADASPRYLQFVNISHISGKTFVAVSPQPEPNVKAKAQAAAAGGQEGMSMIEIPAGSEIEFLTLILKKMEPLWAFRQHVRVDFGQAFETEEWRVRVGDVKAVNPARVRGCVVELQVKEIAGDEMDTDWEANEMVLRRFWQKLGIEGAKEFIRVPGIGENDHFALPRQYIELLRLNRVG